MDSNPGGASPEKVFLSTLPNYASRSTTQTDLPASQRHTTKCPTDFSRINHSSHLCGVVDYSVSPNETATTMWHSSMAGKRGYSRLAIPRGPLEISRTQGTHEELGCSLLGEWFWGFREPSKLASRVGLCPKRQKETGGLFPTVFTMEVLVGLAPGTGLGSAMVPVKCTHIGTPWGKRAAMGEYFNPLTWFLSKISSSNTTPEQPKKRFLLKYFSYLKTLLWLARMESYNLNIKCK